METPSHLHDPYMSRYLPGLLKRRSQRALRPQLKPGDAVRYFNRRGIVIWVCRGNAGVQLANLGITTVSTYTLSKIGPE